MAFKLRFSSKKGKKAQPVGLDIGSNSLKAVELRSAGKDAYELASCGFEELSPDWIIDGTIVAAAPVAEAVNRVFSNHHIKSDQIVTSISGRFAVVKRISVHLQAEDDLLESIRWEAEQHLPFEDISDVNFDFHVLNENAATETMNVLLVAVKKDRIKPYTDVLDLAKKTPVILDVEAFALQNAYEFNYEPDPGVTTALLNIGANNMMINLVSGTEFLFTRDIGIGGQRYTEFLQREFNLDYAQAQMLKYGETADGISSTDVQYVMDSVTEIICMEVQKTFDFFKSTSTANNIDRMLVSGGAAHTPGLVDALGDSLGIPVDKFDSFKRIRVDRDKFPKITEQTAEMAIAVGLALRSEEA